MKHSAVVNSRKKPAQQLPDPTQILRGSLLERRIFHKRGCSKCERGEGHPAWVLTVSYPQGRTKQFSIRPEQKAEVERWLRNYHELRAKLEAICELNHELLRPEQ